MPETPATPASIQSLASQHVCHAEQATLRDPRCGLESRALQVIGLVGGGTMGSGIAVACLLSDCKVVMVVRSAAACDLARSRIESILQNSLQRGLINAERHAMLLAACTVTANPAELAAAHLVIESVSEDMETKKQVFSMLDDVTAAETVLASNTSYLDINEIAREVSDPTRVIGMHFFSPAYIMKLLEIIVPDHVADDVVATAATLGSKLGKRCVLAGVGDGFIGNRILAAYRQQADYLLENGAMPQDIDQAMLDFGFPMGLYAMQDLAGLDIGWARRKNLLAAGALAERYTEIADTLCKMQRYGRKTGAGYYRYVDGRAQVDETVEALIVARRQREGVSAQTFSAQEIMRRILTSMQTEAQAVLAEGVAASADDIDVVMVNGYGFPRWRGGPMYMLRDN